MDLVFPAEQGCQLPEAFQSPNRTHNCSIKRPEPFSIYAGLPRWPTDGMSGGPRRGFLGASHSQIQLLTANFRIAVSRGDGDYCSN
jgi:hypothetical protein